MLKTFIRDKKGEIYLNDSIRHQVPVILVPSENQYPLVTAAAPSATSRTASAVAIIEAPASGKVEAPRFIGKHNDADVTAVKDRLSCEITDTFYRRRLMNRDVLADHIFGQRLLPPEVVVTMLAPFKACESLFLEPQQTLAFQLFNNSTAGSSNFRLHVEGRSTKSPAWNRDDVRDHMKYMKERKPFMYPFWLTTDTPVVIPAGGQLTAFVTVTKDIRFVAFNAMEKTLSTGVAGDVNEKWTVQAFDAMTQRPLSTQPVARTSFAGNANVPYWLPTGWMIEPNTKFQLVFQNLITDQPTEVFLTWHGVACFVG
jgi:hypothetical protein